jgi:Kef-type K+ transport system membrane component KefB
VIAAASIADFGAIILLSLFFSGKGSTDTAGKLILLGIFGALVVVIGVVIAGLERFHGISGVLQRLQDTTAQIRVRGAFVLLIGFVALAENVGLEVILGAFAAGALLSLIDRDRQMTHPQFRVKLEAAGFGIFIPVFFVTSGVRFDLDALTQDASNLAMVPVFLAALLVVRGLPALVYRGAIGSRRTVVAGVLQATSLPFIVAATAIGIELDLIDAAESAALIGAGLLSVLIFPVTGLALLRRGEEPREREPETDSEPLMAM